MKHFLITLALLAGFSASAAQTVTAWTPVYRGVDYATGTNNTASNPRQFAHALRIDLTDPGVQLLPTPPITNSPGKETIGMTVTNYIRTYKLQAAVNGGDFDYCCSTTPENNPQTVVGLQISRGLQVSPQDAGPDKSAAILFTSNNVPSMIATNWTATNTAGIYHAMTGIYPLVRGGVTMITTTSTITGMSTDSSIHGVQPRTTIGFSGDKRYLYLICIDGRDSNVSDGANDFDTASFMVLFGVYDGVMMDGGGSATMGRTDNFGNPIEINRSSDSLGNGRERVVGSHLGIFAQPLPGFINDVVSTPLDTNATVTWTTLSNSTSRVEYGTTTNLGTFTALDANLVTNHTVTLTGLSPNVTYYYRIISDFGGVSFYSTGQFTTLTYEVIVPGTQVFAVTNTWKWTNGNVSGANWTATNYNDTTWNSGLGLLYVENNTSVSPRNTPLPPNGGVPLNLVAVPTFYFRTTFTFTNSTAGLSLIFTNYIDDGAVFYLNGVEIKRVRMNTGAVANSTAATGTPSGGDATTGVPDVFTISGDLMTNLIVGTNVLAAEVHQVDPNAFFNSNIDVVFGTILTVATTATRAHFLTQPTNRTVSVTSNATFSVTGAGNAPLGYQWRLNGANLNNATNASLTLSNVQTNQAGNYSVVITNGYGGETSSVVALTVNRLVQNISFGALAAKQVGAAPFNLTATASSGLAVTFGSSNALVATVSGNTVTIVGAGSTLITASQSGDATYSPAAASQSLTVNALPNVSLSISKASNIVTLSWGSGGYTLQQATQISLPTNIWIDVPGPVTVSPYFLTNPPAMKIFRLRN